MSPELRRDARHARTAEPMPAVLIVEPDPALRTFLRRLLERHDVETLLCASATQALMVLARDPGTLRVVVHAAALLSGDDRRLAEQFAREGRPRRVVLFGGSAPTSALGARPLPLPLDGDQLVRDVHAALAARD
jgi:CheY-like chemotaxis protein